MTWRADRPGNWLFHCHLAYHIAAHIPLASMASRQIGMSDDALTEYVRHGGMGGLIIGFNVYDPAHLAIVQPPVAHRVRVNVVRLPDDAPGAPSFRYEVDGNPAQSAIVLTRGVTSAIDVTNRLNEPTAVHWHGVELDDS